MNNQQLAPLVTSAKNGDSAAMNQLFTDCYHDVYFFLLKTVKRESLAADITQETFLKAFTSLESLKDDLSFPSWIMQIAYRKAMNHFRKKTEILVEEDEDGCSEFDILQEDYSEFIPDEALNNAEFKKTILGMIDSLAEEQRTAILLYYFEEYSVKQIAMIQGVSEGTVKSRLNYSRKAIRTSVEEYERQHDIKLHEIPFLPFLRWLYADDAKSRIPAALLSNIASAITAITGSAASVGTATAATAATATAVGSAAAKLGLIPTAIKIASAAVAATVVVGGTTATIVNRNHEASAIPQDTSSYIEYLTNADLSGEPDPDKDIPAFVESTDSNRTESVPETTVSVNTGHTTTGAPSTSGQKPPVQTASPIETSAEPETTKEDETVAPIEGTTEPETSEADETIDIAETIAPPDSTSEPETTDIAVTTDPPETTQTPETTSKVQDANPADFGYTTSSYGGIKITKYKANKSTVIIPETIDGQPVVEIGANVFYWNSTIRKVVFPDTVVYIGKNAFWGTSNLKEIIWSENLKQVGNAAFYGCGISSLVLPDSVQYLDNCSFGGCKNLTTVELGANTSYHNQAFSSSSLKSINRR